VLRAIPAPPPHAASIRLYRCGLYGRRRLALLFDWHTHHGDFAGVGGPNVPPPAKLGSRLVSPLRPVGRVTSFNRHLSPNTFLDVTWRFGGGLSKCRWLRSGISPQRVTDVDFCWRLQQAGSVIAFSPTAIVWHHRRFTLRAFRKQQEGYGEAESLLRFKHLVFFGPTGTAKWRGQIYGTPRFSWFSAARLFIMEFSPTDSSNRSIPLRNQKWRLISAVSNGSPSPSFSSAWGVCYAAANRAVFNVGRHAVCRALLYGACAPSRPRFDTIHSRLLVMFLAFAQPLVRGWSRYLPGCISNALPVLLLRSTEKLPPGKKIDRSWGRLAYWNEEGKDRHSLLREIFTLLDQETGATRSIPAGRNGTSRFTVTSGGASSYGRSRNIMAAEMPDPRPTSLPLPSPTTVIVNLIVLSLFIYHFLNTGHIQLLFAVPYALFALFLFLRARRLKTRGRELVDLRLIGSI